MVHAWVEHIRQYAKEHNLTYPNAMKDPNCKATYKSKKSVRGGGGPLGLEDLDMERDICGDIIPDEIDGIPIDAFANFVVRKFREDERIAGSNVWTNMGNKKARRKLKQVLCTLPEEVVKNLVEAYHKQSSSSLLPSVMDSNVGRPDSLHRIVAGYL